jgi:hypothetical protein
MPDVPVFERFVRETNSPVKIGLAEIWQHLYDIRFDGAIVLHFQGGRPREVEIPQPIKLKLHTS